MVVGFNEVRQERKDSVEEGREKAFMYDNQRCPKAKGKRRRGLWFVSCTCFTWSPSSLTSLWSAAVGRSAGKAHWERQVGPMCVTRGDHCPNAVGPALPVSGRASG